MGTKCSSWRAAPADRPPTRTDTAPHRVALPLVEALLRRLKQHNGLEGRITAEWLDEGDCVGERREAEPHLACTFLGSDRVASRLCLPAPSPCTTQLPGRASEWALCCSPLPTRSQTCAALTTRSAASGSRWSSTRSGRRRGRSSRVRQAHTRKPADSGVWLAITLQKPQRGHARPDVASPRTQTLGLGVPGRMPSAFSPRLSPRTTCAACASLATTSECCGATRGSGRWGGGAAPLPEC